MQISEKIDGNTARLSLEGRFDFHSHRDFRASYDALLGRADIRDILIDFARVDYLDSSALGMLLLLREKAEAGGKKVRLTKLTGSVKQVLEIANFGKLFAIE
ncbi:anti-sigma factor antagonist [Parasulfuritortus cantonensis]|uniref:Anti-sigma factor antagonist n=1 Tax=Parasulfuritortus cantonensis TaxID=2528202 RepID=A0A4R1BIN5_9PROT|nr:STAS domain-containing protein [Parasulfuritortus cantonensis]TCJ17153.1 anti-sigma factor antagonist [Parasulfuritortus cantonensis]